ncbi:MAG: DUF721 domain-containing protein [Muribaculaceae bacterium]|nr:DUF721 domain-containing protein [Muribaculaceae bacterium]
MKRTEAKCIKDIIDAAINDSGISTSFDEQKLCYLWPEVMGQSINRYTTRRYVENGVLHVYLSSAALKNELQFHRTRLVEELNKAAGRNVITNIIFH